MSNSLGKLIKTKRNDSMLEQQQIAKMIGITNVTLCQVQSGQKKLSREKRIRLATVLEIEYSELLEIMDYDKLAEYFNAEDIILKNPNHQELFLLLSEVIRDHKNLEILKIVISILVKASDKEKETFFDMLEIFKNGVYKI